MSESPRVGHLAGGRTRKFHRLTRDDDGRLTVACDHDKPDAAERVEVWSLEQALVWRDPCQHPQCFGEHDHVRLAFSRGRIETPAGISD